MSTGPMNLHPAIRIELQAVEDSHVQLPKRRRTPHYLPLHAPLPRQGEIIYINSTSAWRVVGVVHDWLAADDLHVLVLVEHFGTTHHGARRDFGVTQ